MHLEVLADYHVHQCLPGAGLLVMRESHRPQILKNNGRRSVKGRMFQKANTVPIHGYRLGPYEDKMILFQHEILVFSPVGLCLWLYSAVGYSLFSIILITINSVSEKDLGFSQGSVGAIRLAVGEITCLHDLSVS